MNDTASKSRRYFRARTQADLHFTRCLSLELQCLARGNAFGNGILLYNYSIYPCHTPNVGKRLHISFLTQCRGVAGGYSRKAGRAGRELQWAD